jgi:4-diphosphocytidyl-2-C-methyl-D-erythritol kinase
MRASVLAPAKINLGLEVLFRRRDGYHEVATLLQALRLTDRVDLALSVEPGVRLRTIPAGVDLGPEERNLVVQAAALIPALKGQPPGVDITLTKRIPVGAGFGGGSADAAAVLLGLDALRGGLRSLETLEDLGATLGSDVPFLIRGGSQLALGRGERLRPAPPLPSQPLVLVFPNLSISTASVYGRLKIGLTSPGPLSSMATGGFPRGFWRLYGAALRNDLQSVVLEMEPLIGGLLKDLRDFGSPFVRVTGSGSGIFGSAPDSETAEGWSREFRRRGLWSRVVRPSRGGCNVRLI